MPTYEYKCENCSHQFDTYQSMKDEKLTKCPVCGKNTLKRLIGSGGGLIFKGSGFYLTDYKNKSSEQSSVSNSKTKSTGTNSKQETSATAENKSSTSGEDKKTTSSADTKPGKKSSKEKSEK